MEVHHIEQMILNAYAQAMLAAKEKKLLGDEAKAAARKATARVVSKAVGKAVSPELVEKIVARH